MTTKMKMRAVFDCSADEAGELSFNEGDILVDVVDSGEDGWYSGRLENTSTVGLFPYNYVERIYDSVESSPQQVVTQTPESISPSSNITIPSTTTTTTKSTWATGNKSTQARSVNDNSAAVLPGFPALDAFEAAMSTGKSSKSTSSNWNASAVSNNSAPPAISPKPKLTTPSFNTSGNQGLGIKPIAPAISEKPQLKTLKLKGEASPTRLRSYSTSSVLNKGEASEKTLRPSQLLNGNGTKSALEVALSKGSPGTRVQSKLRSNSFSKQNNPVGIIGGGVPLVGMANLKLNNSISNDVEEEDGYQMVKPSQLRQRQQQSSPSPVISKSSASVSSYNKAATSSWKSSTDTSNTSSKLNNFSNSPKQSTSSKLEDVPTSTSPMPRLPSRPGSTASRRSRNSRSTSINSSPSTSASSTPATNKANLPSVKETTNEKMGPPILKPKPVISHPNLPPRPSNKTRSSSNPPPLQPKPAAMSSIEILLSKNNSVSSDKKQTSTAESYTPPRVASNKPAIPLYQPKPHFNKSNFMPSGKSSSSGLDNWKSANNDDLADVNIKPSALLNRARSSTNPTPSTDWSNAMAKRNNINANTPRSTSPISKSFESITVVKPEIKKKATPPPPPPSRPPKNSTKSNHVTNEVSKHRYEILFDTIHDNGYVDGETARFIWLKSKLSSEELSRVWNECDPDHKGLLDKHAFIGGMGRIDKLLMNKQQIVL